MLHVAYYEVCTFSPELVSQLIVLSSFSLMPISLCLLFLDANFEYLKVLSKLQAGSIEGQVAEIGLTSTSLIMLHYSIRGPLTPFISPVFYGWTGRGGSSSMVPEPRSWVQFLLAT
jgi:hypothetical protein